jgi:hypothetical protein
MIVHDNDDDVLLARVDRLERRARRERILALAVLAVALATAQAPAPAATGHGPSALAVRGADGSTAIIDGSGLRVKSPGGTVLLDAQIDSAGVPSIDESDPTGHTRQSVFLFASGDPGLRQYDAAGVIRNDVYLASDGEPTFHQSNAQKVAQLGLFIGDKGLPEFDVRNTHGLVMGYISADDQGAYLNLRDPSQTVRVYAGQYSTGAWGLDVRNPQNQTLFAKP